MRLFAAVALAAVACSSSPRHESAPAPGSVAKEGYVDAGDGVRLRYRALGSGPATVIVPGDFLFNGALDSLAEGRTVIFYDMRNRGRSSPVADEAAISIQADVADLEAVRAHFGVERVSLVGWSYLGMMVVLYAADHPDRVERIVQIGALARNPVARYQPPLATDPDDHGVDEAAWDELQAARARGDDRTNPRAFCVQEWAVLRSRLVGDPAHAERLGPGVCDFANELGEALGRHFRLSFETIARLDITDAQLARVAMPVLTIHGTRDRNAPYGGGRDWAAALPDARLIAVDGAGHAAWADDPSLVGDIATFLAGSWPARAQKVRRAE